MSIVERESIGASDARESDYEAYSEEAAGIVRSCPLAGWYPIRWSVLDHNLPAAYRTDDKQVRIVVQPDDESPPTVPLRFLVVRNGPAVFGQWEFYLVAPTAKPDDWRTGETRVWEKADVGDWIKAHRAAQ